MKQTQLYAYNYVYILALYTNCKKTDKVTKRKNTYVKLFMRVCVYLYMFIAYIQVYICMSMEAGYIATNIRSNNYTKLN